MRLLVCGGRDYRDWRHAFEVLDEIDHRHCIDLIIEGGQRTFDRVKQKIVGGADYFGYVWAKLREVPFDTMPADWDRFGKGAGFIRNRAMLTKWKPHMVLAFPGGNGTRDMMRQALQQGVTLQKG